MTNIINFENRLEKLNSLKNKRQIIVLTYGHFSSIHPGHIRYLQNAKSLGNLLVTVLKGDKNKKKSEKYNYSIGERSKSLEMLNICDHIIHLENDELLAIVKAINPSKLVFGTDYEKTLSEDIKDTVRHAREQNIEVIFDSGDVNYSTSDLLENSTSEIDLARKKTFLFN